jgi:hypothetical protein
VWGGNQKAASLSPPYPDKVHVHNQRDVQLFLGVTFNHSSVAGKMMGAKKFHLRSHWQHRAGIRLGFEFLFQVSSFPTHALVVVGVSNQ